MEKDHSAEDARDRAWDRDIAESRQTPKLDKEPELASSIAEDLTLSVDEFLTKYPIESPTELNYLLQKLDTASAINNDEKARVIRGELLRAYGGDPDKKDIAK